MRRKLLNVFVLIASVVLLNGVNGFAQQPNTKSEEIVLTTYYPAPYGDFQNLRLWPSKQKPCTEDKRGMLYYDETDNKVMVCTLAADKINYEWKELGGGGLWSQKDNNIYPDNLAWNVGIGTDVPSQKLDVTGQIHATGDICTDAGGGICLSSKESGGEIVAPLAPPAYYPGYDQYGLCPPGYAPVGMLIPATVYTQGMTSYTCVKADKVNYRNFGPVETYGYGY